MSAKKLALYFSGDGLPSGAALNMLNRAVRENFKVVMFQDIYEGPVDLSPEVHPTEEEFKRVFDLYASPQLSKTASVIKVHNDNPKFKKTWTFEELYKAESQIAF